MIGLDTNILVRYLTGDDHRQFLAVMDLLGKDEASFFVPDLVLVETDWVLSSLYAWTPAEVASAFFRLLRVANLCFEDEPRLRRALRAVNEGADLSDELILGHCRSAGCSAFSTFDKAVVKNHSDFARVP
ncbi:MAG: type II toxin-antitoxin system VapC family toxin [Verrucomicrobiota bacterium]